MFTILLLTEGLAPGDVANHKHSGLRQPAHAVLRHTRFGEPLDFVRVCVIHLTLDLDVDVAVFSASGVVHSHAMEQEVRQIIRAVAEVISFRFIFPLDPVGVEEHSPPCLILLRFSI